MSVYKRNGKWWVKFIFKGQAIRRSIEKETGRDCSTRREALEYESSLKQRLRNPERRFEVPFWDDAVLRWIENEATALADYRKYLSHANLLADYIDGQPMTPIATADIAQRIKAEGKHGTSRKRRGDKPLSNNTLNRRLAIMRRVAKLAHEEWLILETPLKIKLLPIPPGRVEYLTQEQVSALADAMTSAGSRDALWMAVWTGLRRGDLLRLGPDNFKEDHLLIDARTKNRKPFVVPLHHESRDIAERLPLLTTDRILRTNWDIARKATGLTHIKWHDLRHTTASWLVQQGVPLLVVCELLNHSSVKVTERYAHLAPSQVREAVEGLRPTSKLKLVK